MSTALPGCIVSVAGNVAEVDIAGIAIRAEVGLIERPQPGDWVMLHSGVALARIDPHAAQEMFRRMQPLDSVA